MEQLETAERPEKRKKRWIPLLLIALLLCETAILACLFGREA